MDFLDLKDRLSEISRCVGCVSGLLSCHGQIPVTGSELAAVLSKFQREIEDIEQNVINMRFPER